MGDHVEVSPEDYLYSRLVPISLTRLILGYGVFTVSVPLASSWDSTLSQPAMGATFYFPISRLMSAKEVNVPPPKITSHFRVKRAASDPVEG